MRVLAATADVPWPAVGGARTRNSQLLTALAARHDVTVAALDWGGSAAAAPGVTLHTVPWDLPKEHRSLQAGDPGAWERLTAPDAEPFGVSYYDVPSMAALVEKLTREVAPDVVVFEETAMARFRSSLPPGVPFVLDLHDVHAVKQARRGAHDQAERLRMFEAAAANAAALVVCVSDTEAQSARSVLGARRVAVVPNGVDTDRFGVAEGPGPDDRLVFTGSLHTEENAEAVVWFVESVLPIVRAHRPAITLDVVGARPKPDVTRLACDHVHIHADVPDTRPYLQSSAVAVVPLLHGGGTRLKVLEAAACGRSVVTTSVGIEGLTLADEVELDVADSPEDFAAAILRLCGDPALRTSRGIAARHQAERYDWRVIGSEWVRLVESVA